MWALNPWGPYIPSGVCIMNPHKRKAVLSLYSPHATTFLQCAQENITDEAEIGSLSARNTILDVCESR